MSNLCLVCRIASAICCIAAIAGLSNQQTARTGNIIGIAGVAFGLASTLAEMSLADSTSVVPFEQVAILGALGSLIGVILAQKVGPTELPQTVAAFHSLVGLAAMAGAAGEYLSGSTELDTGTLTAIYLATFVGGITATGSMVAFGKLSNYISVCLLLFTERRKRVILGTHSFDSLKHYLCQGEIS